MSEETTEITVVELSEEIENTLSVVSNNMETDEYKRQRAITLDLQLNGNLQNLMFVLREIRDTKSYTYLGFDNLQDYLRSKLPYSLVFATSLLKVSDRMVKEIGSFNDAEITDNHIKLFSKYVNDKEVVSFKGAKVMLSDGSELPILDYDKKRAEVLKKKWEEEESTVLKENKKLSKRLKELENVVEINGKTIETQSDTIKKLNSDLDYIISDKSITKEEIQTIASEKGVLDSLAELQVSIDRLLLKLSHVKQEFKTDNLNVIGKAKEICTKLEMASKQIKEDEGWQAGFFKLQ